MAETRAVVYLQYIILITFILCSKVIHITINLHRTQNAQLAEQMTTAARRCRMYLPITQPRNTSSLCTHFLNNLGIHATLLHTFDDCHILE